jgi:hypothetical protein
MPVAFIAATSAIVGRVPAAVDKGVDSPGWRSLRDALLVAGVLFVAQQVLGPLQWTCGLMLARRIDDRLRCSTGSASATGATRAPRAAAAGSLTLGELTYVLQATILIGSARTSAPGTASAAGAPRREIRFERVTFADRGAAPVLRDLD